MKETDLVNNKNVKAICVMSGGADSLISLFWAIRRWVPECALIGEHIEAVTFDYGQRHKYEIECAKRICKTFAIPHTVIQLSGYKAIEGLALLSEDQPIEVPEGADVPTSFVPGRNIIFLTYAAALAYTRGCHNLVTGVCQTDYSGYADCRDSSIKALQGALALGLGFDVNIHTPLMWLTKAESIKLAKENKALQYLRMTHTCYEGKVPSCGLCPSCKLRIHGFKEAGIIDPIEYAVDIDWEDCKEVK